MKDKPYALYTPPFDVTSGGIRVMWGLYGWLLAKGQVVHPNAKYADDNFIAIYPEIMHDNPAGARHVVRYILNKPGVMGLSDQSGFQAGPEQFGENDELYYFSRLFGEAKDEDHYMFLPILNMHVFTDQKKNRNKTAYFVGKGWNSNKHPEDAILIDRQVAADQQNLADLLNQCEVLYCYDPVTAMTELARLCGCRVVIIPSIYMKQDFLKYEPGMNGISWGKDEEIQLDSDAFRDHYIGMTKQFEEKLDNFIERTQSL